MVLQRQPLFHHLAHLIGQRLGVGRRRFRQQHAEAVFAVARHPVVLPEVGPHHDADPFEHAVTEAVAVGEVEVGEAVDVQEQEGQRVSEALGPPQLLFEGDVQHGPAVERRHRIGDDRGADPHRLLADRGDCVE